MTNKKIVRGKNGGKRPGSGRKQTGRNTVTIAFSVHKDYKEIIRQTVFAKVNELKAAENKPLLPKDRVSAPTESIIASDKFYTKLKTGKVVVTPKGEIQKESEYLKQRRKSKLGDKKE